MSEPATTKLFGIDKSHWQSVSDWYAAHFAFLKSTQACTYHDSEYWNNVDAAKTKGIFTAPYHFLTPDYSGAAQADYMLAFTGMVHMAACDWETNPDGRKPSLATTQAFCDRLHQRGVKRVIYATTTDVTRVTAEVRWPAWLDSWGSTPSGVLRPGDFRQFSWSPVDEDWFYGDSTALKALFTGSTIGGFLMALTDKQQQDVYDNSHVTAAYLNRLAQEFGIDPDTDAEWMIHLAEKQQQAANDAHIAKLYIDRVAKAYNIDPASDPNWLKDLAKKQADLATKAAGS